MNGNKSHTIHMCIKPIEINQEKSMTIRNQKQEIKMKNQNLI